MTLLSILEQIAATDSRKEKERILGDYAKSEFGQLLKSVIHYAYSKSLTYGVKAIEKPSVYTGINGITVGFIVLERLAARYLTGNAAIQEIKKAASYMTEEDAEVFFRIIGRDLRCGCAESTFNKVFKNVIESPPYMRCTSFSKKALKKIKFPCISEVKADGMYVDVIVSPADVVYRSRSGDVKPFNVSFRDTVLSGIACERGGFVLMGEALVLDENGEIMSREDGNGYLNSDDIDPDRVIFTLWDIIDLQDYLNGKSKPRREDRVHRLDNTIQNLVDLGVDSFMLVESVTCYNVDDVISHFKEVVSEGLEGTVLKNLDAVWKNGNSSDQVKLKIEAECDIRVIGILEGEGKYKGQVGSLLCTTSCGELLVGISGLKDSQRKDFWENRSLIIDKIITVRFNDVVFSEKNSKHSLFLPRFVEIREDKTEPDSLERVFEQLQAVEEIIKSMFDGV